MSADALDPHIRYFMATLMSVMATVATLGNALVVFLYCTKTPLKKNANLLIANMAVADLCVGLLSMSAVAMSMIADNWIFGRYLCILSALIDNTCLVTSMYLIMMISIERYIRITNPRLYRKRITPRVTKCMVSMCWFCSVGLSAPPVFGVATYDYVPPTFSCGMTGRGVFSDHWFLIFSLLAFFPPILSTFYCYGHIFHTGWKVINNKSFKKNNIEVSKKVKKNPSFNDSQVSTNSSKTSTKMSKKSTSMPKGMKLSMTILIIIALVLVFNFPVVCLGLLMYANVVTSIPYSLGMTFHFLWYIHSSLNPLIFLLTVPDFTKYVTNYYHKSICYRRRVGSVVVTTIKEHTSEGCSDE